jgi:hypothetical protein
MGMTQKNRDAESTSGGRVFVSAKYICTQPVGIRHETAMQRHLEALAWAVKRQEANEIPVGM